jgi:hypothetical protein
MRYAVSLLVISFVVSCAGPTSPSATAAVAVAIRPQPIVAIPDPSAAGDPTDAPGVSWWRAGWSVDVQVPNARARVRSVTSRLAASNGFVLFERTENAVVGDLDAHGLDPVSARYPKFSAAAAPPTLTVTVAFLGEDGNREEVVASTQLFEASRD